jgi:hypothetical protein
MNAPLNTAPRRGLFAFLAAFCLALAPAFAKSADDYFHGAAHQYVAGKIQEASVEAEEGLRLHPGDAKLRALAEQLRKMKDQQRGNPQGGGKDQKKDPGKKPGDQDQKDQKDPDKQNPDDKNGDKPGDKEQDKPPPKPGENQKDPDDKNGGKGPPPPGRMSEEEAKRLLNSFADDEKKEQAERRKAVRQRAGTEQDW